jgi:hypothetical protein
MIKRERERKRILMVRKRGDEPREHEGRRGK